MLINPDIITDLAGLALSAFVVIIHVITYKKEKLRSHEKA